MNCFLTRIICGFICFCSYSYPGQEVVNHIANTSVRYPSTHPELETIQLNGKEVMINTKYKYLIKGMQSDNLSNEKIATANLKDSIQSEGPLIRKVLKRANIGSLSRAFSYEINFDICIAQSGEVILSRLHSVKGLSDKKDISIIQKLMFDYLFNPDDNAPKKECGMYTFKISPVKH